jgi:hypothetical protein
LIRGFINIREHYELELSGLVSCVLEKMNKAEDVEMGESGNSNNDGEEKAATYLPGQPLKEDEELVCDESVYVMLHEVNTGKNLLHVVGLIH